MCVYGCVLLSFSRLRSLFLHLLILSHTLLYTYTQTHNYTHTLLPSPPRAERSRLQRPKKSRLRIVFSLSLSPFCKSLRARHHVVCKTIHCVWNWHTIARARTHTHTRTRRCTLRLQAGRRRSRSLSSATSPSPLTFLRRSLQRCVSERESEGERGRAREHSREKLQKEMRSAAMVTWVRRRGEAHWST